MKTESRYNISSRENTFENVACKIAAILFRPQYVDNDLNLRMKSHRIDFSITGPLCGESIGVVSQHRGTVTSETVMFLTHCGRDKMAAIFQTTFSNAFSWMKMFEFRLRFHWSLFPMVWLTIFQHWFRWWLGAGEATSHYLNQWWLVYWRIYASLGLNELIVAITEFAILLPSHVVKSLQLFWRSGTRGWNLRVPDHHLSCHEYHFS